MLNPKKEPNPKKKNHTVVPPGHMADGQLTSNPKGHLLPSAVGKEGRFAQRRAAEGPEDMPGWLVVKLLTSRQKKQNYQK